MKLPTQNKPPITDIGKHALLISGAKKTGKTSFAVQFPDHFMFEMELGNATHLDANYEDIPDFATFDDLLKQIEANPTYCKTIIIDEVQLLYNRVVDKVRIDKRLDMDEKLQFEHWRLVRDNFQALLDRIKRLRTGVIYTAHLVENEVELRSGGSFKRMEPRLSKQCKEITDDVFKCCFTIVTEGREQSSRFIQLNRDEYTEAYNCFSDRFINQLTGHQLKHIPMGESAVEAYNMFMAAFDNQLSLTPDQLPRTKAQTNSNQQQRSTTQQQPQTQQPTKPRFVLKK